MSAGFSDIKILNSSTGKLVSLLLCAWHGACIQRSRERRSNRERSFDLLVEFDEHRAGDCDPDLLPGGWLRRGAGNHGEAQKRGRALQAGPRSNRPGERVRRWARVPCSPTRRHHGRWRRRAGEERGTVARMACPFLREVQVKYCRTAAVRKLIPLAQGAAAEGRCASADHTQCKAYQMEPEVPASDGPCPYLTESLMQYCGAAPVTKFVPYSESSLSRCGRQNFRYCELYQAMAHP